MMLLSGLAWTALCLLDLPHQAKAAVAVDRRRQVCFLKLYCTDESCLTASLIA
jgi:hypothetical protein